jgi:glutamate racemase
LVQELDRPIGIFDSGIGGLTVVQAIRRLLPNESFVYVGDTAHMPYGDKSPELIRHYALNISSYLLSSYSCKAIVIACNTASAAAYSDLRDHVIADQDIQCVGIIATKATIQSGVYQEKFSRRKSSLKYKALATPLLAPMIEEGFYNNSISNAVLHKYLDSVELQCIDALILACTHYPLIKGEIEQFYKGSVKVIDSAEVVARKLKTILEKESLAYKGKKNEDLFYITDYSTHFEQTAKLFYGEQINLKLANLHVK